jgi:hypothetical protein
MRDFQGLHSMHSRRVASHTERVAENGRDQTEEEIRQTTTLREIGQLTQAENTRRIMIPKLDAGR